MLNIGPSPSEATVEAGAVTRSRPEQPVAHGEVGTLGEGQVGLREREGLRVVAPPHGPRAAGIGLEPLGRVERGRERGDGDHAGGLGRGPRRGGEMRVAPPRRLPGGDGRGAAQ
jgi:hypothetical protein